MSFSIGGWIEVALVPETEDEYAWSGVVHLGAIVNCADEDTERFFGLSRACVSGEKVVDTLAGGRGIPANPSKEVRKDLEEIVAHEAQYGPGEVGGYTHATWGEIRRHTLLTQAEESELKLAFALAKVLEERFGTERIRFIVWYIW